MYEPVSLIIIGINKLNNRDSFNEHNHILLEKWYLLF
jgi:hypothetical protein